MGNFKSSTRSPKEVKVIIAGYSNSGKTSVLYRLMNGTFTQTIPTVGWNAETMVKGHITYNFIDLGGGAKAGRMFEAFYKGATAVLYTVDSTDRSIIADSQEKLAHMLQHDDLWDVPFLILANKADHENLIETDKLTNLLKLNDIKKHKWNIMKTSTTTGEGIDNILDWINNQVQ